MAADDQHIIAIDIGTSTIKIAVFDRKAKIKSIVKMRIPLLHPRPGWIEQDPEEIWKLTLLGIKNAINVAKIDPKSVTVLGLANQRGSIVVWDSRTGKAVHNVIVWQCRRTENIVQAIKREYEAFVKKKTGLIPSSNFSGVKIKWLIENRPKIKEKLLSGEFLVGTLDTFILWKLSNGKLYMTDYTNASRTLLFNIHNLTWDKELLDLLEIPEIPLPEPKPSCEIYGHVNLEVIKINIPVGSVIGDQQASLFGHTAFRLGSTKCTYGTGNFVLMNTGEKPVFAKNLLTTIAWGLSRSRVSYAIEGSLFTTGSAIDWLINNLGLLSSVHEIEEIMVRTPSSNGVYFVPALLGLGAPYWNPNVRGLLVGLKRSTTRFHIIRAVLESIAYATRDIIEEMEKVMKIKVKELRVDGGLSNINSLMQFQADILGVNVVRPKISETTLLGTAYLAGLAIDIWQSLSDIEKLWEVDKVFKPHMDEDVREKLYLGWKEAVRKSLC